MQAFDKEEHKAVEGEDDEENDYEFWELVLNDGDEIIFPVTHDEVDLAGPWPEGA